MILNLLKRVYGLLAGSGFLWRLARNYKVLKDSCTTIEQVLQVVSDDKRSLPNEQEAVALLAAVSNILKTGVIDIPGIDEMKISIGLDHMAKNISLSIEDSKTGKFMEIPMIKK